jgi:peptidoglycan/LPS O-acetylase OafA/YrhL
MTYRPDIDGLRALAVLAVVLNHAGIGLSGGFAGVDVFFVISGYLIASLMLNDLDAGTFSLAHFWERRIRRIVPALSIVVGVSFVVGWFALMPQEYEMFGRSVVSLAAIRSNVFFARHIGYFAAAADEKPLLHTWSLAVEEQFYLLAPLVLWGVVRLRRQAWLTPLVGMATIAGFIWAVRASTVPGGPAYFQLATRAWEPLAGVLTALYLRRSIVWEEASRQWAGVAGLALIAWSCCMCDATTVFPGVATLLPVLGTVLLIVSGHRGGNSVEPMTAAQRWLSSRWAVGIGLISYSLYLWHWPLIVLAKSLGWESATLLARSLLVAASLGLAYLTYRYVERPFRRRDGGFGCRFVWCAAAVVLAVLACAGQMLRWNDGAPWRLPEQARLLADTGLQEERYNQNHAAADVPRRLLRLGTAGPVRLVVWGDSHAMAVLPAIDEACRREGVAGEAAVGYSRPPVIRHSTQATRQERQEADAFGRAMIEHVRRSEAEVVLLAAIWQSYFGSPEFGDSLVETARELRAAGKEVYFLRHVPTFDVDVGERLVFDCWRGRDLAKLSMSPEQYAAQCRIYEGVLAKLRDAGVKALDPIPYLRREAPDERIPPYDSGGAFYCDANHLSAYGARVIGPVFGPMIDEAAHGPLTAERKLPPQATGGDPPPLRR